MLLGLSYKNRIIAYLLGIKESAMFGTVTMFQDASSARSSDTHTNTVRKRLRLCVATVLVIMTPEHVVR